VQNEADRTTRRSDDEVGSSGKENRFDEPIAPTSAMAVSREANDDSCHAEGACNPDLDFQCK
jgi:hypothetical protein